MSTGTSIGNTRCVLRFARCVTRFIRWRWERILKAATHGDGVRAAGGRVLGMFATSEHVYARQQSVKG